MKKIVKKENIIFGIVTVLIAILLHGTVMLGRSETFPLSGDYKTQILFLGDSNIAYDFEGVSIPTQVMERLDVSVYNCAIGGTTAAKINTGNYFDYNYDLYCLYHLVKVMENGDEQAVYDYYEEADESEQLAVRRTALLADIDYEQLDYVVISYGLNDYTAGCAIYAEDAYNVATYSGALKSSVEQIMEVCPNAKIILSSITYCVHYANGEMVSDGYTQNWGGGYINDYRDAMEQVAAEYESVYFMDNLECLGIDESNYEQYLRDEMHLNPKGQSVYVDNLIELIEEIERNADE